MARNLSHDLKRIIAGMCALLIVSGTVPMKPVADVFKSTVVAKAAVETITITKPDGLTFIDARYAVDGGYIDIVFDENTATIPRFANVELKSDQPFFVNGVEAVYIGGGYVCNRELDADATITKIETVTLTNIAGLHGLEVSYGTDANNLQEEAQQSWSFDPEAHTEIQYWTIPAGSYVKIQSQEKPFKVGDENAEQGENEWTYVWEGTVSGDIDIDNVYSKLTNAAGIEFTEAYFINDGPESQNTDLEFNNGVAEVPYGSYVYLSSEQYFHVGRREAYEDLEGYYYSFDMREDATISLTGKATLTNNDEILFNEAKFSDSKRDFDEGYMGDIEFSTENAAVLGADSYVYLKASDAFKVGEEEAELVGEEYIWQGFIHTDTEITKVEEAEDTTTYVTALAPFEDTESEFSPDTDLPGFTPVSKEDLQNWDGAPSGRVCVIYDVSSDEIHMSYLEDGEYVSDVGTDREGSKSFINNVLAGGIKIYYFSDTAKTLEVGQYIGVKDTIALEGDTYGKIGEDTVKLNDLANEYDHLVLTDMLYADGISFKGYIAYINDDHDVYFPADEEDPTISGFYVTGGSGTEQDPFTFDLKVPQNKSAINPTVTIEGWKCNEDPNAPVVEGNDGNGDVTYTYYKGVRNKSTSEFTYTEIGPNAPTGVGNYKVVATIAETEGYLGATAETTFVVDRADWDFEASAKTGLVYNGKDQLLMTVTETNQEAWDGIAISTEAPNRLFTSISVNANELNVGDVLCPSKSDEIMIGDANYGHGSLILKTDNEDINVSRIYYEGNEFRVNSFSDDKEHRFDGYDSLIVTKVEGGDAFVELHNYNAEIDNVSSKWQGYYYDEDPEFAEYNYPTAKNAGEYTLYWTRNADANHNGLKGVVTANIAKAPATVKTAPTAVTGLKYDGTERDLVTAGAASGGKMMYTLDAIPQVYSTNDADTSDLNVGDIIRPVDYNGLNVEGTFILEGNEYTDTINVYVDDNSNTFEIITMDSQEDKKIYQADEADSLIVTGINDGVVTFGLHKFNEETDLARNWTDSVPKAKNAGTYTVYYKAASEDDNHIDSDVGSVDVTIAKAAVTATITGNSTTVDYDGQEHSAVGYEIGNFDNTLYDPNNFTFVGDNAPTARGTNVGSYSMGIVETMFRNADTNFDVSVNITDGGVIITQATNSWTTEPAAVSNLYYDSTEHDLITAGEAAFGTAEYRIYTEGMEEGAGWNTEIPKAITPGTYVVQCRVGGSNNYTAIEKSVEVIIAKADITPIVTINGWTYGSYDEAQNAPSIRAEVPYWSADDTTYEYKVKGADDSTYTATVPTNAGEYTVRAIVAESQNFEPSIATADFTIAKADPGAPMFDITLPTGDDLVYSGTAKSVTAAPKELINGMGEVTVKYYTTEERKANSEVTSPTNAGTYYVGLEVAEGDNYNASTGVLFQNNDNWKFTIAKADPGAPMFDITLPTGDDLVYDGTEKAATAVPKELINGMGEVTVKYYSDAERTQEVQPADVKNAGTYYVGVTVTEGTNYNEVTADDVLFQNNDDWTFTIDKAELSQADLILVAPEDTTYDGTAKVPAVVLTNGRTGLGTPTFTYENISTNKQNLSQAVDAGEYYVTVSFTDGDNFYATDNAIGDDSWSFTIDKAAANVQVTPVANLKYDGTPKNLLTVNANYGTMEYKLAGDTNWSQGIPQQTKAGTYNISWRYTNDNYETASGDSTVTISPKTVSVTWSNTELVYDGTEKKPTAQLGGVVGDDVCAVTVSGGQTEEGSYTATAVLDGDDKDNYALDDTATSNYSIILSGEVEATTAKRFVNALNSAGVTKITLTADIDPTRIEDFYGVNTNRDLTIDLNGHKLDNGTYDALNEETVAGTLRSRGGTLTITDSSEDQTGKIINIDDFMADGGNIVIDGGSYEMTDIGFTESEGGKITINGGSFRINDGNGTWDENWDAYLAEDMEVVARENAAGWYDVVEADDIEEHVTLTENDPVPMYKSGKTRITSKFSVTVDDGYTIEDYGLIYCNNGTVTTVDELINGTVDGTNIKSAKLYSGNILDNGQGTVVVGFVKVKNAHGKSATMYTGNLGGNYNEMVVEAANNAVHLTESEPVAIFKSEKTRVTSKFSVTVDDGYTIEDYGLIYCNNGTVTTADELINGTVDGTNIKSAKLYSGNILDNGQGTVVVGFVKVKDVYGIETTKYTGNIGGDYNKMVIEAAKQSVHLTESEPVAILKSEKTRVTSKFSVTVDDGYTIEDYGLIYCNNGTVTTADELINGTVDGTNIKSAKLYSGNILDNGQGTVVVGFVKVKDEQGREAKLYTGNIGGNYNEMVVEAAKQSVHLTESEPVAILKSEKTRVTSKFSVTVDDGYTIEDYGLIYCNNGTVTTADELINGTVDGTNIKSAKLYSGNILDNGQGTVVVGFVKVKDEQGREAKLYTGNIGGSYADLTQFG